MGKKSPKNQPQSPPASPPAQAKKEPAPEPQQQQSPKSGKKQDAPAPQKQQPQQQQKADARPQSPQQKGNKKPQQAPQQVLNKGGKKPPNPNKGQPNRARRQDPADSFNAYHEEMDLIWNTQGKALIEAGQKVLAEAPEAAPEHSDPHYPFLRPDNPNHGDNSLDSMRDDSAIYGATSFLTAPKKRHQKEDKRRNLDEDDVEFTDNFWAGKKKFQKGNEGQGQSGFTSARAVLRAGGHRGNGQGFRGR
jgi:hypothetical protein